MTEALWPSFPSRPAGISPYALLVTYHIFPVGWLPDPGRLLQVKFVHGIAVLQMNDSFFFWYWDLNSEPTP
jgi:hypothetical protein